MPWARNLLFVGLIVAGIVALTGFLFPRLMPAPAREKAPPAVMADDFAPAMARVDAAFRTTWKQRDLTPAEHAPELLVARRLSLGLTGTVPSLQEIRQFEAQSGDRLQWWLDGLLRDRRFADYFAERLARSYVGVEDGPFIIYRRHRFVDWLSEQVRKNRPYNEITREILASSGIWTDKPAVNFITVTIDQNGTKEPDPERLAGRVSRAFLARRIDCAQCHNHPFERELKQAHFQGLAAMFGQTRYGGSGIHDDPKGTYEMTDRKSGDKVKVDPVVPYDPELLPAQGTLRERLAGWVTHPRNKYFSRALVNRVWGILCSRPLVDPVDDIGSEKNWPEPLNILADDFVAHNYDIHRLIRIIVATEAFHLDSQAEPEPTAEHAAAWAVFPVTLLRPEQMAGSIWQASAVQTYTRDANPFIRLLHFGKTNDFVKRYGDTGEDEFRDRPCTIPQVLLVMNGDFVNESTRPEFVNASRRIGWQSPDDRKAIEAAFLCAYARRPEAEEVAYFETKLRDTRGDERSLRMEDLFWALMQTREFKCNH
jgi:Protein of unknown function (DUF1549)/Protein of unknown function (DUF1553)